MKKIFFALLIFCLANTCYAENAKTECSPTAHQNKLQQAIKWYRDSAEQKALYRQVYNLASNYVRQWVKLNHPKEKTWGVVLDIDETTLNNSWYFYQCEDVADNESDFEHFVSIPQKSTALPGVVNFTHLVHELGGYVSLISNRDGSYSDATGNVLTATVNNLKQQKVEFDQVILGNYKKSKHPTDKNPRFNAVIHGNYIADEMVWSNKLPTHPVVAYFGDNIQDFPVFKQSIMSALPAENNAYDVFGHGYFILPNPMYGSWESNQYR